MNSLKTWLKHNMCYNIHYSLDNIYLSYVENMYSKGSDERFIMLKASLKKRLVELSREDNPCIGIRKNKDKKKTVYFKREERIEPVKTNHLLSTLGQKAMRLYPDKMKWWEHG